MEFSSNLDGLRTHSPPFYMAITAMEFPLNTNLVRFLPVLRRSFGIFSNGIIVMSQKMFKILKYFSLNHVLIKTTCRFFHKKYRFQYLNLFRLWNCLFRKNRPKLCRLAIIPFLKKSHTFMHKSLGFFLAPSLKLHNRYCHTF